MIRAEFFYKKGEPKRFAISGHAGFAESGKGPNQHSKENDVENQAAELGIFHVLVTSLK